MGSWHHHRFKGKVEIVGYCLENKSENQVWSCLWLLPSHAWAWVGCAWAWEAAPGRGHADIKCCFAFSEVLKVFFRVSKANIQTRVNREHLGKTLGLGETFYHLGNNY